MELRTLFVIEKEGLVKTMKEYFTDPFIVSYCKKLLHSDFDDDIDIIKMLLPKLLHAYDIGHIDNIINGIYVMHKKQHLYTYHLLMYLVRMLDIPYKIPEKTVKPIIEEDPFESMELSRIFNV